MTLDKTLYSLHFKEEVVAAPVTSKFSSLLRAKGEACSRNIIIIMCINNNALINNNCGRTRDLILLFKIALCKRPQKGSLALGVANAPTLT
jgi:hypothetical protein